MAEQAVLQVDRMRRAISRSSAGAVQSAVWFLGPSLLLGLLAAVIALQFEGTAWRSKAEVAFQVPAVGTHYVETQANLARSRNLALRVVTQAGVPGMTVDRFLQHSSATPPYETESLGTCIDLPCGPLQTQILTLSVSDQRSAAAVRLTNAYGSAFVRLERELYARRIQRALDSIRARMRRLRGHGQAHTSRYSDLAQIRLQLKTSFDQSMPIPTLKPAEGSVSFRPHALRNGLLGGVLGALLGVAVAVGIAKRRA